MITKTHMWDKHQYFILLLKRNAFPHPRRKIYGNIQHSGKNRSCDATGCVIFLHPSWEEHPELCSCMDTCPTFEYAALLGELLPIVKCLRKILHFFIMKFISNIFIIIIANKNVII